MITDRTIDAANPAGMILRCLVVVAVALQGAAGRQAPKALLINLPRHKERFDTVKAQLDSAGVAYERAPACDGSHVHVFRGTEQQQGGGAGDGGTKEA